MKFKLPTADEMKLNKRFFENKRACDANGIGEFSDKDLQEMGIIEETFFEVGGTYKTVSGNRVKIISDEGSQKYPLIGLQLDYGNIVSTFKMNGSAGSDPCSNDLLRPSKMLYVVCYSDGQVYATRRTLEDAKKIANPNKGLMIEMYEQIEGGTK